MSKEWERVWRPNLHLVCCLVFGVVEYYCVVYHDMQKSSCQNLSVLSPAAACLCVCVCDSVCACVHVCALQSEAGCWTLPKKS